MTLAETALPADRVGLLEGLTTTRAIRRYTDEPVPREALRAMLFAATRGPSGSNRQPFRFVVLTDGPKARTAKQLIAGGLGSSGPRSARRMATTRARASAPTPRNPAWRARCSTTWTSSSACPC